MKLPPFTREEIQRANRNAADIARAAEVVAELQRRGIDPTTDAGLTGRIAAALDMPESEVSLADLHRILKERSPYRVNLAERMAEGFDRIPGIADFSGQRAEADRVTNALLDNLDRYQRPTSD